MATQVITLPRRAVAPAVNPILKPTLGGLTLGALSSSTGAVLIDAAVGAGVGYLIAPKSDKTGYMVGGSLAVGVAGGLGLLGLIGWRYLADRGK